MASSGSERRHDQKWRRLCDSLHEPPPLPTLPSDVIPEILCRLQVKFILGFRCVCKSWNSLISDPKFIKKQLRMFTTLNLHFLNYAHDSCKYILTSYPLESVFTNITSNFKQSDYSSNHFIRDYPSLYKYSIIGSCNGIVCIADGHKGSVILWNPSTREFKELPLFEKPHLFYATYMTYGFGYDSLKDNYKVVVVLNYSNDVENEVEQVKVHTLGTNIWRTIHKYPFGGIPASGMEGQFVSGTINWTKLFNIPYMNDPDPDPDSYVFAKPIYMFEDDQMLLKFIGEGQYDSTLFLYDPTSGTLRAANFKKIPEVCGESLISPCSLC